jgi:hypothetical protein
MALIFTGTLEDLQRLFARNCIKGSWEDQPNGVFMFRTCDSGNAHWASTSKALWFSGKPDLTKALSIKVEHIMRLDVQLNAEHDDDDIDFDID